MAVSLLETEIGHTERHRKEGHVKTVEETRVMQPQAKGHLEPQKLEEARRSLPSSLQREHGPADALMWTPDLRNFERINFYGVKPLGLWNFVTAAPGN